MKQQMEQVSYTVHESDMARSDRKNKRLWMTVNGLVAVLSGLLIFEIITRTRNA